MYCITIVDRTSRWPEAIPTSNIDAETVSNALLTHWISRFGVPATITTDQGRQFESQLFNNLLKKTLGAQHIRTTAYHPAANGKIERWHCCLKSAIMAVENDRWTDAMPLILLGLRSVIITDLDVSPAQLTFGTELRLPGDFFDFHPKKTTELDTPAFVERLRSYVASFPTSTKVHGNKPIFVPSTLATATHIFLRVDKPKKSLEPPYTGPHRVLKPGEKFFTININGKEVTVSTDRLKPAFLMADDTNLPSSNRNKKY